jgi:hypothetical protein
MKRLLVSALKRIWPATGLAAVLLLAAACAGDTPPDSDDELNPANETGTILLPYYKSLDDLVRWANTIVVGRVAGTLLPCLTRPGFLGDPEFADCALHPGQEGCPSAEALSRPPGRRFTVYSVEIQQVIASESLRPGDSIGFLHGGGICEDTPPEVAAAYDPKAAYETELDPMIEIGSTYLLFLVPQPGLKAIGYAEPWGTTYEAAAFGRFLIGADGRLQIVAKMWTCDVCAAPKALAGKTLAEAETTLRPLIEQARLTPTPTSTPTPTPQPGTPTPTPTPTPQLVTPTPSAQLGTPTPTAY